MGAVTRIFTVNLLGLVSMAIAADVITNQLAQHTWEEDVEILGFTISACMHEVDIAVDGFVGCRFELSQTPLFSQAGNLGYCSTSVCSYIVVAAAQNAQVQNGEKTVIFSGPERLTMPEGSALYINSFKYGLALKVVNAHCEATVYYRRR